ncbi:MULTISPECIES: nickel-responsive transcriptional regulator NikR [unclassified Campylobacter]|uniref:nickel-responsive transcriptional regulator NikR n=1 Tax=unclassified Campylobacter TaxID=2593542 RepID=UPI0022E9F7D0|nr:MULTISPECIES: nickel-responsive transcriptional regulator NikR [unclassified Campylobacter]MDA3043230.1 nickel-responsive transcriptional regulator NikR [Campylobacter sp. JMF_09 ED2]MDA3045081.1 nickel-responsive transcriptional regulator NikR [Campylobacter sp. JMF_07 ED4]MDA3064319.1 nickel-responsive transcriptional regulator NikR [Campylobacter sp. JMF_11 EL3]MDA3071864.1 nickel-responsive transcriptional regulator NikR [Campylobacter sp. VBCF_03 NA9]MDA3075202.1 nickel-responsive tran
MDNVIRFSVSLPEELFDELNSRVQSRGYPSRSEYIRDLIREKIVNDKWSEENSDKEGLGVICIAYSHHQSDLLENLIELEHHAKIDVVCTNHIHVDHDNCLETINVRGKMGEIEKFSAKIGGLKGVKFSQLVKIAITKA